MRLANGNPILRSGGRLDAVTMKRRPEMKDSIRHRMRVLATISLLVAGGPLTVDCAETSRTAALESVLDQEIDLARARAAETRYYYMETSLTHFEEDGSRAPGMVFKLWLEVHPATDEASEQSYRYVCRKFTLTRPGREEVELPTLRDWTYSFSPSEPGIDSKGQVFGIPHAKFALMVDNRGGVVESGTSYMVYNNFIDFHGLNDVFASRTAEQIGGLQNLHRIGDKIVHGAANTVAPVGLGEAMKKGSVFRNGEVTLELKGLSTVDGLPCALLEYDSGDSSYLMFLSPMEGMEAKAEGASHYFGDLYVELGSGWLRKGTLHEFIVSRVTPGKGQPNRSVIERSIRLEAKSKSDFDRL
jgi:hypothetical protein